MGILAWERKNVKKMSKREEKYFRRQQESRNRKFPAAYQRGTIKKSYYFARSLKNSVTTSETSRR
jgi:hypothetical protein